MTTRPTMTPAAAIAGEAAMKGATWIPVSERYPTMEDSNEFGDVWWWHPRYAKQGPQCDYWHAAEGATHWMRMNGMDDEQPLPPAAVAGGNKGE